MQVVMWPGPQSKGQVRVCSWSGKKVLLGAFTTARAALTLSALSLLPALLCAVLLIQAPYIQHKCLTTTTHNSLLLGQLEPFRNYPKAQCITTSGPCDKLEPGCASGLDRIYCVGLKPWYGKSAMVWQISHGMANHHSSGIIPDEVGSGAGYDFGESFGGGSTPTHTHQLCRQASVALLARSLTYMLSLHTPPRAAALLVLKCALEANKVQISGLFPGGAAMVGLYSDTTSSTRTATEANICAPSNPLRWPAKATCVLTRFYAPPSTGESCYKAYWKYGGSKGPDVKSAKDDGALMLIGCGITSGSKLSCVNPTKGPSAGLPGGAWGDAVW
jgi:hypothetical protein